jgi:hypothetical protein
VTQHALVATTLQVKTCQAQASDANGQLAALQQAMDTLDTGDADAIQTRYLDAVRKMAIAQVRVCPRVSPV